MLEPRNIANADQRKDPAGRLAQNIVYFARALRAADIPVGPKTIIDALDALKAAGVGTREDFYWTLHAVFVKRHEHSILFDQAFRLFFRKRAYLERLMAMMMHQVPAPGALFRLPTLAATYGRLLTEAEAAGADREAQLEAALRSWYSGFVAEAVERFCRQPVMDEPNGCLPAQNPSSRRLQKGDVIITEEAPNYRIEVS